MWHTPALVEIKITTFAHKLALFLPHGLQQASILIAFIIEENENRLRLFR